ncbi:MAG: HlyC/CorC family transporter [Lachnospiraceae bacterium]|nr:HlyC/CorC family transporter [Lachnospiraceae bacterium]
MGDPEKRGLVGLLRNWWRKRHEEDYDEEILSLVNDYKDQGAIEEDEAEMISNIMEFSETQAKNIMTNRTKIEAFSTEDTLEHVLHCMLHSNYSRYPLYEENLDNIVGILYLKDVILEYLEGDKNSPLQKVAREPFNVPETMPIDALFGEMQSKKIHMAIVIDEYGQTSGIVAMEDILEEIVGDILDEFDEDNEEAKRSGDELIVSGSIPVEELKELADISFSEEDEDNFETLNGILVARLGHIPEDDESGEIRYGDWLFRILSCENRRIAKVAIRKIPAEQADSEEKASEGRAERE